jgi:short-subunit dehydrogenase
LFARDGYELVLVARSPGRLNEVAGQLQRQFDTRVKVVPLDLAVAGAAHVLFEQLARAGVVVDVLVNNAGFGARGPFSGMAEEEILGQIALNITALTQLTRLFLPGMIARRQGKILHVASTAAFQPGPLMAVYFATKAYVLSFSQALANELAGSGVVVSCFCPGATDTGFQKRAGMENSRLFKKIGAMKVETVAQDGYRGLMSGKILVFSGLKNRLSAEMARFAPRRLVTAVARWTSERVQESG